MTPADKAALMKLHRLKIGTDLERACVNHILARLATGADSWTELELEAVRRLLMKYGEQLGL